jgi:hypothetical protein
MHVLPTCDNNPTQATRTILTQPKQHTWSPPLTANPTQAMHMLLKCTANPTRASSIATPTLTQAVHVVSQHTANPTQATPNLKYNTNPNPIAHMLTQATCILSYNANPNPSSTHSHQQTANPTQPPHVIKSKANPT